MVTESDRRTDNVIILCLIALCIAARVLKVAYNTVISHFLIHLLFELKRMISGKQSVPNKLERYTSNEKLFNVNAH